MIKRNGRWLTDEELYPEQFMDLPEEAEVPVKRNRAVKLGDIDSEGEGVGRNSDALRSLLGTTAPNWKSNGDKNTESTKAAVNPRKTSQSPAGRVKVLYPSPADEEEVDEEAETEEFEVIRDKKRRETAKAYAMKVVASNTVTERKLTEKLISRNCYTEDEIAEAVAYVKSFGYVNDARLAQNMVDKLAARCWGRFKICYYLKGKGIDEDTVEALDFSEVDFPFYCAKLMRKYPESKRDTMRSALKNAGYTSDDIRATKQLLEDEE